ncbi:MAG: hypothetical protein MJ237_00075 [bacterium]|nr:hypothetical protein [bacterium]
MQVSAISVSSVNVNSIPNNGSKDLNFNDSVFKSFGISKADVSSDLDIFDCINKWKCFCHKQIIKNNTDYIA